MDINTLRKNALEVLVDTKNKSNIKYGYIEVTYGIRVQDNKVTKFHAKDPYEQTFQIGEIKNA